MGILGKRKKRIGFWAGDQNNFHFVEPLIEELGKDYLIEKFEYFGDDEKLKNEINSVDLCWFEWCGGPVIPASKMGLSKPMINRIHRFELYLDEPKLVDWHSIDKTIFSSPSMILKFKEKFPSEFSIAKPELVEIGVDLSLFEFKDKPLTKTLVYVGRIHPHKNPSILLQIIAKLTRQDSDYKLIVIGGFSDELYEEYFYDQINKLKVKNNVEFLGKMKQPDIVKLLQEADFFIITSIIEGLSQASLEGMACGARPVIFDYYGSEKAYPTHLLYRTIDEAVDMILKPVISRREARALVEAKYDLSVKKQRVSEIIKGLLS